VSESGQATAEYAWILFVLLGGAAAAGWPYLRLLLEGLARYFDSIYFVLDGPFP
jgi:hypothetical protein